MEDVYAAMDVFVLPSHREGMSNALLEAQARGLPCVTTDATGCADAVEEGVTGYVVPARNPARLAEALDRLASSPQSRDKLGQAGPARMARLFDQQRIWSELERLYSQLAEAPDGTLAHE